MLSTCLSSDSESEINLKELQSRIKQRCPLTTLPNISISDDEFDDSDRDTTWVPTRDDLASSSDDNDCSLVRRTPIKTPLSKNYASATEVVNEQLHTDFPTTSASTTDLEDNDIEQLLTAILTYEQLHSDISTASTPAAADAANTEQLLSSIPTTSTPRTEVNKQLPDDIPTASTSATNLDGIEQLIAAAPLSTLGVEINEQLPVDIETTSTMPEDRPEEICESSKRKRKSKKERQDEQKKRKLDKIAAKYLVKPGCGDDCKRKIKCKDEVDEQTRNNQNHCYWSSDYSAQKMFIMESVHKSTPKRAITGKKSASYKYTLKKRDGTRVDVCKMFFLATLGFNPKNDIVITHMFKDTHPDDKPSSCKLEDTRGKSSHPVHNKDEIKSHVESYKPTISHYRRAHAPLRRYLPPEITITQIHKDYVEKTGSSISYGHFQKVFNSMNISMAVLGHEECEVCAKYNLHKSAGGTCDCENVCNFDIGNYLRHKRQAGEARNEYQRDTGKEVLIVSADLQKVIMLPRIDQFKEAIFTRRLTVFNETFAAVSKGSPTFAVLWHEGVSARNDEDISSAFYQFLMETRDAEEIVFWLDNCGAQNKNWTFYSMLVTLVNSDEIQANKIVLKYFQPGHTFMSADSCHSRIEKEMKKMQKVYDFNDFVFCVRKAKCTPIVMEPRHFRKWQSGVSYHLLNKLPNRPKLASMVYVSFQRGSQHLFYKNEFSEKETEIEFLKKTFAIEIEEKARTKPRGIPPMKKSDIISKLLPLMPANRHQFWKSLTENTSAKDLATEYE